MGIVTRVASSLQEMVGAMAEDVARRCPVVLRRRKFTTATLARTFVFGFLSHPRASDEQLAQVAGLFGVHLTTQALEQRFTPRLAAFLEALFREASGRVIGAQAALAPILERFAAVYLLDSTVESLPEQQRDRFPGCGGSHGGGRAAMKLQVLWELRGGALQAVRVEAGRHCDYKTPLQAAPPTPGSLRIADLGYFDTEVLQRIAAAGAYFLSRLQYGTSAFSPEGQPLPLLDWLGGQGGPFVDRPGPRGAARPPAAVAAEVDIAPRAPFGLRGRAAQQPAEHPRLRAGDRFGRRLGVRAQRLRAVAEHHRATPARQQRLVHPALRPVAVADAPPGVELVHDLHRHRPAHEDPLDRVLRPRPGAHVDPVRAQGHEARHRQPGVGRDRRGAGGAGGQDGTQQAQAGQSKGGRAHPDSGVSFGYASRAACPGGPGGRWRPGRISDIRTAPFGQDPRRVCAARDHTSGRPPRRRTTGQCGAAPVMGRHAAIRIRRPCRTENGRWSSSPASCRTSSRPG